MKSFDATPYFLIGAAAAAGPVGWLGIGLYGASHAAHSVAPKLMEGLSSASRTAYRILVERKRMRHEAYLAKEAEIIRKEAERFREAAKRFEENQRRLHPPPTIEETYDEVLRRFEANLDRIKASPLSDERKHSLILQEQDELERRIAELLE